MKKTVAILLTFLLVATALSCFASGVDLSSLTDEQLSALQSELNAEVASRRPSSGGVASGSLGKYNVTVLGARMSKDYNGADCIVVSYEWSHSNDDAKNFMFAFSAKAFQDGIELEMALMPDGVDSAQSMLDIRSGAVLQVEKAFVLRNTSSPVEAETSELMSFTSKDKVVATFNLPL